MKKKEQFASDKILFGAIFGSALALRLLLLGVFPLREGEARWAYQAWELWQGQRSAVGFETGYLSITRLLFALFGSSTFLARLWPAVMGSFMVWVPYMFRNKVGRNPALIMALGFAVDPGFLVSSRSVGSPMTALVFLFLTAGLLIHDKNFWGSICGAFFLLSGRGLGFGLFVVSVTLALAHILKIIHFRDDVLQSLSGSGERPPFFPWTRALWVVGGVLLLFGTSFFSHFEGVSAWVGGIPAFLRGWVEPSSVSVGRVLLTMLVYQPLPILFGLLAAVQGMRERDVLSRFLSLWFVVALAVVLLYPGRQTWDLIWALVPLWGLTGLALSREVFPFERGLAVWILAGLIFILFSLMWLSFLSLATHPGDQQAVFWQWGIIVASMIVGLLSVSLFTAERSWQEGKQGLIMGVVTALILYMVSGAISTAYIRADDPRSFWYPDPGTAQLPLLIETVQEMSVYQTGREDSIRITVYNNTSSLKWAFRDFPRVRFETYINGSELSPLLITDLELETSQFSDEYLGQDFVLHTYPGWQGVLPSDWKRWVAFREGQLVEDPILLWVERDVYPGGDLIGVDQESNGPSE
ncbi:MAG: hypothetical protein R6U51_07970 [Anaerolineales bacterium]